MATESSTSHSPSMILSAILKTTEDRIIPITRDSVTNGGAPFGAAVLSQSDLRPLQVSINAYRESPLLHGETNCIREFFQIPDAVRPETSTCIFFATHEPCSLCLSGIAWTGFPLVFFIFTYEETRRLLDISGDIEILEEVFRVPAPGDTQETLATRALYNKQNKFFTIRSLADLLQEVDSDDEKRQFETDIERVREEYYKFSCSWRKNKEGQT